MTIAAILLTLFAVVLIVWLNRSAWRLNRDGSWHFHGDGMRRFVGGRWERREMTERERAEREDFVSW